VEDEANSVSVDAEVVETETEGARRRLEDRRWRLDDL
jgi:hypothetical protein